MKFISIKLNFLNSNQTEVTVLVSRIPVVVSGIRRSECGRIAVVCKYDKLLENVTYASSVNVTRE